MKKGVFHMNGRGVPGRLWLLLAGLVAAIGAGASGSLEAPREIARIEAPFAMPQLARPAIPARVSSIVEHGARPLAEEPGFKNTAAIHRAIAALAAAEVPVQPVDPAP